MTIFKGLQYAKDISYNDTFCAYGYGSIISIKSVGSILLFEK